MFVHLHTHSHYSFLEGLASPAGLAAAAAQSEMPALALTDTQGLTGAVEFWTACQEKSIRPILGSEFYLSEASPDAPSTETLLTDRPRAAAASLDGPLVLLVQGNAGWANLCKLNSLVADNPGWLQIPPYRPLPGVNFAVLAEHSAELICLTGGAGSILAQLIGQNDLAGAARHLQELAQLFPGRLYVELQIHTPADVHWVERAAGLARSLRLPLAASHNIFYLRPAEQRQQRLAAAMRLNLPLTAVPGEAFPPPHAYFPNANEMLRKFTAYPEAAEATLEIAGRCQFVLPLGEHHYPTLDTTNGRPAAHLLRERVEAGARRLYPGAPGGLAQRLEHELNTINELGYAPLFLIMEDIIAFARQNGVPYSSRGSAASSLVAHCLGITSPDPLRLDLYFERFLNPARRSPPDIDTDLCSRRREDVIRYVYQRFGEQRVAMVATINRFRPRSALREVAKAYGLAQSEIKTLAENLPGHWWSSRPDEDGGQTSPFADLQEQFPGSPYREIFRDAIAFLGRPHHLSVHPGGVVIAPDQIQRLAPVQVAGRGIRVVQFDHADVEKLGLLKIDLLGIRGLTVLGDVCTPLASPLEPDPGAIVPFLEAIPEDDPQTTHLIESARTIGCFQIESPGMRATLRELGARSVDDLMVALALFRPGPLTGGLKNAFVRAFRQRSQHPAAQTEIHPALTALLAETFGVFLYQEQVLKVAHELAGFSLADADLLRRAMSHFDPGKQMITLREKFLDGALSRSGVPEAEAARIWELMIAFSGYGFPKAHAASYAQLAWRAAWCKAHHPHIFMAAVLANWGGFYSQRVYLTEARRLGLQVRPPHVNYSQPEFSVQYPPGQSTLEQVLFMGLNQVKQLTRRTQARLLRERPFRSLADFLLRADPRPVEAVHLARIGALDGFGSVPDLLDRIAHRPRHPGQLSLFPSESTTSGSMTAEGDTTSWTLVDRLKAEEEILGIGVSAHPLDLIADRISGLKIVSSLEASTCPGQMVLLTGMRQSWTRTRSRRGEMLYSFTLEDLDGSLEVLAPLKSLGSSPSLLNRPGPFLVEGRVEINHDSGEPLILAQRISRL